MTSFMDRFTGEGQFAKFKLDRFTAIITLTQDGEDKRFNVQTLPGGCGHVNNDILALCEPDILPEGVNTARVVAHVDGSVQLHTINKPYRDRMKALLFEGRDCWLKSLRMLEESANLFSPNAAQIINVMIQDGLTFEDIKVKVGDPNDQADPSNGLLGLIEALTTRPIELEVKTPGAYHFLPEEFKKAYNEDRHPTAVETLRAKLTELMPLALKDLERMKENALAIQESLSSDDDDNSDDSKSESTSTSEEPASTGA